jgi:signal transduction histidine kinase
VATASAESRRVLLLHSYGRSFAPWNDITGRFRAELVGQSPYPIDLYEAELQGERFEPSADQGPILDYLRALFAGRNLDLVVAMGAPAARFILQNRSRIFPSTPMLIAGAAERTFTDTPLTANDTAVAPEFDEGIEIDNILRLLPDTTGIAVVMGTSPIERFWADSLRRDFARFAGRVTFEWLDTLSLDQMVARVAALPPGSAIYYTHVHVDAAGVPQEHALERLRQAAKAPIFSFMDSYFGQGVVGGPMLSGQELARRSAAVAVRILGGEPAGSIKTLPLGPGPPMYDWRELRRWNISESVLLAGSIVQFRLPTTWELYRWQIVAGLAALMVQAAMIAWLLIESRRRRRAEIMARATMAELTQVNRIATAGELSASIAHEINQPLTGMVADASAAIFWLKAKTPNLDEAQTSLRRIVSSGLRAGAIVANLRAMFGKDPAENAPVDVNKVVSTVLEVVRLELRKRNIELETHLANALPSCTGREIQLQQVMLNLVMNAVESIESAASQPRKMRVTTEAADGQGVRVSIEDSGTGIAEANLERVFEPLFTTKPRGMGMGLAICRSIIESHGGGISVLPAAARGAVFRFDLPASRPD